MNFSETKETERKANEKNEIHEIHEINENGNEKHRVFQKIDFESFAEKRRKIFLETRKNDRESRLSRCRRFAQDIIESNDKSQKKFEIENWDNNDKDNNNNNGNNNQNTIDNKNDNIIDNNNDKDHDNIDQTHNEHVENNTNNMGIDENKNEKLKKKKKPKSSSRAKYEMALQKSYRKRMEFVSEFMIYDWMIDIPKDLKKNWLVGIRPKGERCLVLSHNGRTISRTRNGNILHQFPSELPSGNFKQKQQQAALTILDCIFVDSTKTYYVIDIIYWLDHPVYDSDAEFRLWFLKSKLNECYQINQITHYNHYIFLPIQIFQVNSQNLQYLYDNYTCHDDNTNTVNDNDSNNNRNNLNNNDNNSNKNHNHINKYAQWPPIQTNNNHDENDYDNDNKNDNNNNENDTNDINMNNDSKMNETNNNKNNNSFTCDGFIFFHKHGRYEHGMSSPLVLLWKDEKTSPWFIDNNDFDHRNDNNSQKLQYINLRLNKDNTLTTYENEIILNTLSNEFIKKHKLKQNDILKFSITNAYFHFSQCKVDNLTFIKKCSLSKMLPDTWSKIVFQNQAIYNQNITFSQLKSFVTENQFNNIQTSEHDDIEDILHIATLGLS